MTNQNKLEIRTLPVDMQTSQGDGLKVQGYVNMTGSVSEVLTNPADGRQFRETILPHVFGEAVNEAQRVDFLYQHDKLAVLSSTENQSLSLVEDNNGLFMRATISETSWGKDTYQLIQDGIIKGMSFGMVVVDSNWAVCEDGLPLRMINQIKLYEVSAVRNPAYRSSTIEARDIDQVTDIEIPDNIEKREDNMAETEPKKPIEETKVAKDVVEKKDETSVEATKKPVEKREDDSVKEEEERDFTPEGKSTLESSVQELVASVKSLLAQLGKKEEKRDDSVDDEPLPDDPELRAKETPKDEKPEDKKDVKPTGDNAETKPAGKKVEDEKKPFPFKKEEKRELVDFFNIETREVK